MQALSNEDTECTNVESLMRMKKERLLNQHFDND